MLRSWRLLSTIFSYVVGVYRIVLLALTFEQFFAEVMLEWDAHEQRIKRINLDLI